MRGALALPEVSPRMPAAGPIFLVIPGLSDVAILAATTSPEVKFTWPAPYLVSGVWLWERDTATPAAAAGLKLRMVDADRNELLVDGTGAVDSGGALSLMGRSPRWHAFRRVVRAGQKWLFQIENANAFAATPLLYFRLESQ